jgi:hypothetical protein
MDSSGCVAISMRPPLPNVASSCPDGKVVVVVATYGGFHADRQLRAARLNADGTVDPSFRDPVSSPLDDRWDSLDEGMWPFSPTVRSWWRHRGRTKLPYCASPRRARSTPRLARAASCSTGIGTLAGITWRSMRPTGSSWVGPPSAISSSRGTARTARSTPRLRRAASSIRRTVSKRLRSASDSGADGRIVYSAYERPYTGGARVLALYGLDATGARTASTYPERSPVS